ncbi:hypothetical protein C900_03020 [Fulvivirga imtechensis AK7]|uniref:Methyltransferase domain-containing protein n=1 Tax=Fulvivirga imtechensis AK7 TaxID=1237149 RepID=L8JQI7_9BACT|nr:class I SAM-dependent methyltransferase [Fulvivirga imtechensis]ELR71216.1 hypothetical protein C900_03020 [Fulvivirga imtechensis AK7]
MTPAFDHIAFNYDQEFTHSSIGALQRQKVWDYLDENLPEGPLSILELNCGTGEDAIHLAGKGHYVLATDISEEMIKVAASKTTRMGLEENVSFLPCDLNKLEEADLRNNSFNLIFSDFGGLNCLDTIALKKLGKIVSRLLKPGGHFIGVIMPDFCVWESCYFLSKLSGKKAFRRAKNGPLIVNIHGQDVETWYYSPKRIEALFADDFQLTYLKPIGFFLPPSYLEVFFKKRQGLLNRLDALEEKIKGHRFAARYADHFLIDLELKNNDK